MKKIIAVLILVIAFGASCKKKDKTHFSTWTVNGEKFTAHANGAVGKAIAIISGKANSAKRSELTIYFNFYGLPTDGNWPIADGTYFSQNPSYAYLNFYYNDKFYIHPGNQDDILHASLDDDRIKAHYALSPTWFVNYDDYADSVLISGDFFEPYQNTTE